MLVGTPLYEEEEGARGPSSFVPTKKVDPLWKQEVVDAEGRRRFHGAFTGGYSAGYFNTVGSAEGWAPKSFKSSRSNRNSQQQQQQQQTAEEFMDEDDLTSFGGKQLQTNSQYDSLGSTAADIQRQAKRAAETSRSVIPGDAPDEFVTPTTEGIGKQLLRLMGWREGQGVGPRQARKRNTQSSTTQKPADDKEPPAKRYSCPLPPGWGGAAQSDAHDSRGSGTEERQEDGNDEVDDDPYGAAFLFAPKNTATFDPGTGKDNFFGLGFDPFVGAPEFRKDEPQPSHASLGISQQKRGAFGIGALEDEDDHEVYDHTERSEYDFETGEAEDEATRRRGRHGPSASSIVGPSSAATSSLSGAGDGGKCSDGMPALVGFVVATRSSLPAKWYTAPTVPNDFRPFHMFKPEEGETGAAAVTSGNWVVDETTGSWRLEKPKRIEPNAGKAGNRRAAANLSSSQRGSMLGELAAPSRPPPGVSAVSVAPPPPRLGVGPSLMSLNNPGMSESDRQKIAATLAAGSRFVKASDSAPGAGAGLAAGSIPAALAGCFLPDEPAKQARLEAYYREQNKTGFRKMDGVASEVGPWAGAGMTEWEVSREKEEFAELIRGGAAAAEALKSSQAASGGLQTGSQIAAAAKAAKAVRRSTTAWAPVKLLCKRFNVPDPYGGKGGNQGRPEDSGQGQTRELLSLPDEMYSLAHKQQASISAPSKQDNIEEAKQPADVSGYSAAAEDVPEKPVPNGIFKAIFEESSSEDDEDDEDDEDNEDEGENKEQQDRPNGTPAEVTRGAMGAVEEDPLQSLFRESGRYDPLPGQPARGIGTVAGKSDGRAGRAAGDAPPDSPAVVVPQGSLKRGVFQQGGWLSRDPIPNSGGKGRTGPPHVEPGGRVGVHAESRGPMGRGMGATQPAWMTADTQPSRSGRNFPAAERPVGPDNCGFVRNRNVDTAARKAPRRFDVQRPASSPRGDAREHELRQAMIASAVDRRRVAGAEQAEEVTGLPGAAGSSTSSSDDGEESDSEEERRARKKSKRSHKKEKKSKHKKKKRKNKKDKAKKSHSSRR
eukprot:COSAG02_NODE_2_length_75708_cov_87.013953_26_plen_1053_part_00